MKSNKLHPFIKRLMLGSLLGGLFGILCFFGFVSNDGVPAEVAKYQVWSWSNVMMWSTITNRILLGVVVAIGGVFTKHPWVKFRIGPILRGVKIGGMVSLPMALGSMIGGGEEAARVFWLVFIAGMIIGVIIDVIITKVAGEGRVLVDNKIC